MFRLFKFNYKEMISNKVTLGYVILYCLVCGIIVPIIFKENFFPTLITLNFALAVQIGPTLFVREKENATLETILTTPISMKTIFYSKVWFCYSYMSAVFLSSCIGVGVVYLFRGVYILTKLNLIHFILSGCVILMVLFVLAYHVTYTSLIADDGRACAIKLIFITVIYSILPISFFSCLELDKNVLTILFCFILVVCLVAFLGLTRCAKTYFSKSIVFSVLNKVV